MALGKYTIDTVLMIMIMVCRLFGNKSLTLNSIRGPFRPESNLTYTQHWYLADVTLKTLRILQPRLSEWRKPIKILKRKSRVISKLKNSTLISITGP